ncbi:Negative regulator of mitotic exit [Tulasnella sp. 418]|nr:Negative regulator of mitotic exit [Tulasnella sp. 418]
MDELMDSYSQTKLKEQAEDRTNDAIKRAEFAENAHENGLGEHWELIEKHTVLEGSLRDHIDRLISLSSATWQKDNAVLSRALTTGGLGQLLGSQGELLADEDRATRGHVEKLRAMELEAYSLRKMLKEAGVKVDAAQINGCSQDVGPLRKDLAMRDAEL